VIDKTGTLTHGQAAISEIRTSGAFTEAEVLYFAASLDQASGHVVAATLVEAANQRGLSLSAPVEVDETPGLGIEGLVDGRRVVAGGDGFVQRLTGGVDLHDLHRSLGSDTMTVAVAVDGALAGVIVLQDRVRADAGGTLVALRQAGVERIVLASGDKHAIALAVGEQLGVDLILGNLTPEDKVQAVRAEAARGLVMMVGDGVNDAPALAAADVGVAMGARGTAASSEAAGVVVLVDALGPLAKAIVIAGRTRNIARQSVFAGLGLSVAAMLVAAFGYLPPVQGALLQEAIDVAVILNALRALR
ncbi:MAG TPA: HAD-IC family P-type ATPase, partial [Devosia sp.]|nr:HAD-IC family P-type ATPase [Devosia sp.]